VHVVSVVVLLSSHCSLASTVPSPQVWLAASPSRCRPRCRRCSWSDHTGTSSRSMVLPSSHVSPFDTVPSPQYLPVSVSVAEQAALHACRWPCRRGSWLRSWCCCRRTPRRCPLAKTPIAALRPGEAQAHAAQRVARGAGAGRLYGPHRLGDLVAVVTRFPFVTWLSPQRGPFQAERRRAGAVAERAGAVSRRAVRASTSVTVLPSSHVSPFETVPSPQYLPVRARAAVHVALHSVSWPGRKGSSSRSPGCLRRRPGHATVGLQPWCARSRLRRWRSDRCPGSCRCDLIAVVALRIDERL